MYITKRHTGFTLAEVLITLGIIGIVAALTLPAIIVNIQDRINAEKIRNVKYKITMATDTMKSLDLIGPYNNTADFIKELQKHLVIAKVCPATDIKDCWSSQTVVNIDGTKTWDIRNTQTGVNLRMTSDNTHDYTTPNVALVLMDGSTMVLSYNTRCNSLDSMYSYPWTQEDNKPVTNATANCIAAVFDYNGAKGPNKLGKDVQLFNANGLGNMCAIELPGGGCYGAIHTVEPVTKAECEQMIVDGYGINACKSDTDYWAGAVKECGSVSNLISNADLDKIATQIYGSMVSGYTSSLHFSSDNSLKYGLPISPSYKVWTNEEKTASTATLYYMEKTYVYPMGMNRSSSNVFVICKSQ